MTDPEVLNDDYTSGNNEKKNMDNNIDPKDSSIDLQDNNIDIQDSNIDLQDSRIDPQDSRIDLQDGGIDLQDSNIDPQDSNIDLQDSNIDPQGSKIDPKNITNNFGQKNKSPSISKKEMAVVFKQNKNFTELLLLHEKHDNIIKELTSNFDANIKNINGKYLLFRKSLEAKLKDCTDTCTRIDNERINMLSEHGKRLVQKINVLQNELYQKEDNINKLSSDLLIFTRKNIQLQNNCDILDHQKNVLENKMMENTLIIDNCQKSRDEIQNKHILLLNENVEKQNNIDEKIFYIISLNSKITELERKNSILESDKVNASIELIELANQTDNLNLEILSMQKLKLINEKLNEKLNEVSANTDQIITEIKNQYQKEIIEQKNIHKREKDTLMMSHNETIKRAQELHDELRVRLNQSTDALNLSKVAITNLKIANSNLEKQTQNRGLKDESQLDKYRGLKDESQLDKYKQFKNENILLREKLEKSIELNNTSSAKEKYYENQFRQLQSKYNQLVLLTKKYV